MRFDTIHRYNDEIKRIDKALDDLKEDIEKHPDKTWNYIHYVLLNSMQESLKEERDRLKENSYYDEEKYNEDFTNEMQHIKQEQSDELNVSNERYRQVCQQLREEQRRIEELKENYYKISADLMCKIRAIDRILNNSHENINEEYTVIENSGDELAVACARAKLDLITKIVDEVKKI